MDDIHARIKQLADTFWSNAQAVNNSTRMRRESGNRIIEYIDQACMTATTILEGVRQVVAADINWSSKNASIFGTSLNLRISSRYQKKYAKQILESQTQHRTQIERISSLIDELDAVLIRAEQYLQTIMKQEQEILVLDKLIEAKKKYQLQSIRTMQKLSAAINADTKIAETDSAENTERGQTLKEMAADIGSLLTEDDSGAVQAVLDEVEAGIRKAREVNTNSKTQSQFAEQVRLFVEEFMAASYEVQRIIQEKHELFEENLQNITVLTVIISFELKKYLEAEQIINSLSFEKENKNLFIDLMMLVDIASREIKGLTDLNLDMTEISHVNNENETRTVDSSSAEQVLYADLRDAIDRMTELTKEPIRLSEENIRIAEQIRDHVYSLLSDSGVSLPETQDSSGGNRNMSKRVMVIDDGAAIRQVVSHVLKSEGYEVLEAVDGHDALSKLDEGKIDLFICDVNMPNMNGIEFLEKIKTEEAYRNYKFAPVIMLTTESGQSMKEKGKQLGAHAWMVKPFQPDQLIAKIKPILG